MTAITLDHVNIVTDDLPGTACFYRDLLGLDVRDGPPPLAPSDVQWLYDGQGRAIIHANRHGAQAVVARDTSAAATGAIHHVAFSCTGYSAMEAKVAAMGLAVRTNALPSIGLRQMFVEDPNGVLLELNFFGD